MEYKQQPNSSPLDAELHPLLFTFVHELSDIFSRIEGDTTEEERSLRLRIVLEAAVKTAAHNHDIHRLITKPSQGKISRFDSENRAQAALCVAIAIQNESVVRQLVSEGVEMWTSSTAFGLPFRIALRQQDIDIVKLVKLVLDLTPTDADYLQSHNVPAQIVTALLAQQGETSGCKRSPQSSWEILETIITWHLDHIGRPRDYHICTSTFVRCLRLQNVELLCRLIRPSRLNTRLPSDLGEQMCSAFFASSIRPQPRLHEIVPLLTSQGIVNIHQVYGHQQQSILDYAVWAGNAEAVQLLQGVGAQTSSEIFAELRRK